MRARCYRFPFPSGMSLSPFGLHANPEGMSRLWAALCVATVGISLEILNEYSPLDYPVGN